MAEAAKNPLRTLLPAPSPKRRLVLLGGGAVVGLFVLLTFTQNWGKATAQRDILQAKNAAQACIANPHAAAGQCAYAAREIGAALPEMEKSDKAALTLQARKTLAQVHMAMGQYAQAAELYRQVAAATPQQSIPYQDVAQAYSLAGKHRAAERYARLAVQLAPDSWKPHLLHGRILARAGKAEAALGALRQAHDLAPAEAQANIRQAMEKVRTSLAMESS